MLCLYHGSLGNEMRTGANGRVQYRSRTFDVTVLRRTCVIWVLCFMLTRLYKGTMKWLNEHEKYNIYGTIYK